MIFRVFLATLIAPLLLHCGCDEKPAAPTASDKPNVLLVTFDTTRADYLSCYGRPGNVTPNIDRIANEGMRFEHCYAPAPITLPSHASIMTGLYPFEHKLRDNGAGVLDDKAVTLAELFKSAGYRTGAFVGAYVLHSRYGLNQGFEVYSDEFEGRRAHMHGGVEFAERTAQAVSDAALSWLDQKDDRPLFLWVHYFDPHAPYEAPGRTTGGDVPTEYAAEIHYADEQMGRVLRKVENLSQSANRENLVVITADHGEGLGEHREESHGLFAYNSTIRVPLVARGPGLHKAYVSPAPVSLIDIYPTITQLVGIASPYIPTGINLLRTPHDNHILRPLYFETHMPFRMYGWSPIEGVVCGQEKFISVPTPELFDLNRDPAETNSIAGERKDRVAQLAAELDNVKKKPSGAPTLSAGTSEVDLSSIRKLQSLGYVSVARELPADTSALPDPKNMIALRETLARAEQLLAQGEAQGVERLEQVLKADPNNTKALTVMADHLHWPELRKALIPLARQRLQEPVFPPFDVEIPAALGLALCKEGSSDEGLAIIGRAQELEVKSLLLKSAHTECLIHLGRFDEAARIWETVLAHDSGNAAVTEKLGDVYVHMKDMPKAAEWFSRAVGLDPRNAQAHAKLADVLQQQGRTEEAVSSYRKALQFAPQRVLLRKELASLLLSQGKPAEAAEEYAQVVAARPDLTDAHYDFGVALIQSGKHAQAAEQFRETLRLSPGHGDALINLGLALLMMGQTAEGIEQLTRASQIEAVAGAAHFNLAIAARRAGNAELQMRHLEQAAASRPPSLPAIEELRRLQGNNPSREGGPIQPP